MTAYKIPLSDIEETKKLGTYIAHHCRKQDVVMLTGDLGTGKTTLVRSVIGSLVGKDIQVISPTFNLLCTYETPAFTIYHYDLYRLKKRDEIIELGLDDALAEGVTFIEWPEKIMALLPSKKLLHIHLDYHEGDSQRLATINSSGKWDNLFNDKSI